MAEEINCHTGLEPNNIPQALFDKELTICRQLNKEGNGKCGWGTCATCGVIPLLYKLHKGELLEDPKFIADTKDKIFNQQ